MAVTSETQLANIALSHMGEGEISDIDSATDATAVKLEEVFDQNRDFVMEAFPWPCLIKRFHLVLAGADAVESITAATPPVVGLTGHAFTDGMLVTFKDIVGMTELNGGKYIVDDAGTNDLELTDTEGDDLVGVGYTAWVSGGTISLAPTGDWGYVYDLPADCLKPLGILDEEFTEHAEYEWLREGSIIYCSVEDAALRYIKKETTVTKYSSNLAEAIAYRLAWLTCLSITGSSGMRTWLESRYDRELEKMRGSEREGGSSQDRGETSWVNAR